MLRLLGIQFLGKLDIEAEEIHQFSSGINLGLPGILALAEHGSSHDLISVFPGDEVCSLEEDGGAVGEGEGFPGRFGC